MDKYVRGNTDAYSYENSRSPSTKKSPVGSPQGYTDDMYDDFEGSFSDSTMKLPVKNHMIRLEDNLDGLRSDLDESKKNTQMIRADIMAIEHSMKEGNSEMMRAMMEECLRVEKEFRKMMNIEKSENEFLKQQMRQLTQDKMKLQQNTLVLENRVEASENDVGFKNLHQYRYDQDEQ